MAEYIERKALLDYIDKRIPKMIASSDGKHIVYIETVREVIVKFPTADVAPVRHGRWVNENYYTRCSVCGKMAIYDKYGQEVESDYCPRCGARMDGDADANGNDNKTPET